MTLFLKSQEQKDDKDESQANDYAIQQFLFLERHF